MQPRVWRAPGAALLAAACAAMAGCAAAHPATGQLTAARSRSAASPTPRQRAVAEAAALVKDFAVPAGARRLRRAPAVLKDPITVLGSTAQVDATSFWLAPGRPQAVLAWEKAHVSRRFTLGDSDNGPPSWDQMFSLPAIPGVITTRELVVEVTGLGHGQTGIRVDAWVAWQPARPASERVPSAARVVTLTQLPSPDPRAKRPPAPVTLSGPAVVQRLAALVDSLPLSTIGPYASCPAAAGGGIKLTFRARAGGAPLAVAQGPAACGTVQFSIRGKQQPALQLTSSFIAQVLKVAGLRWKVLP